MGVNKLKRLANLNHWRQQVADCRSSGFSVQEWCKQNQICLQTYYRWEQIVLAEALGQEQAQQGASERDPSALVPAFVEVTPQKSISPASTNSGTVATIRCGAVSIDIYTGTDLNFIVSLCKELQHAQ